MTKFIHPIKISPIFHFYSKVIDTYVALNPNKNSFFRYLIERGVEIIVRTRMALSNIKFPRRVIGGWWWTWRWRLEILAGWYEHSVTAWCHRLIRPGMVVVDIGAHIGYYTWLFSKLTGHTGKIVAYEASPENFSNLVHNIKMKRLKNVYPIQAAVCDRSRSVDLFVSPGHSNHSLIKGYTTHDAVIEVAGTNLDNSLASIGISHVDFIKIDAEGAEPNILRGMSRILENSPSLIMLIELSPNALRAAGIDVRNFLLQIADCGLIAKVIYKDSKITDLNYQISKRRKISSVSQLDIGYIHKVWAARFDKLCKTHVNGIKTHSTKT